MLLFLMAASTGSMNAVSAPAIASSNAIEQQTETCKGVVKDAMGETVIGASVVVKGTTNGTITGIDGDFTLSGVSEGSILVISYVGYVTQEVKFNGQPLNVILKEDSQTLEEVVVVGYGVQKKANLTGAVATVNAKGKITAKKKGTATITVYSKADKKKTCKIKVTVGTPVTKVKLNKTKANLNVGKSLTLKTTLSPKKPSNKGIIWKSSNTKVATVTSKGVVKAKKAGTTTITATAKDGSGKKAACKITVKKAAVTPVVPEVPVVIRNVGIVNKAVIQVTLNKAKILQTSDFAVSSKVYGYGNFVRKCVIDHLETTNNITYKLYLDKQDIFYNGDIVQVSVPTLNSTKELTYRTKPTEITIRSEVRRKKGTVVGTSSLDTSGVYDPDVQGYAVYTVSNLPTGLSYKVVDDADQSGYLQFYGTLKETGIWETKVDVVDEFGNKIHYIKVWKVYDERAVIAQDITKYGCLSFPAPNKPNGTYTVKYGAQISPIGGNGSYKYEVVSKADCLDLVMSTTGVQYCSIDTDQAGEYTMKIKISDSRDASVFTYCTVTFVIKPGVLLSVTATDLDGNKIKYTGIDTYLCRLKSQWKDNSYSEISYAREVGEIEDGMAIYSYVPEGVYDISIEDERGGTGVYASDYYVSAAATNEVTFALPVYQQTVVSDNTDFADLSEMGEWQDENGVVQGKGGYLYLAVGNYTLTGTAEKDGVTYQATLKISVTNTTRANMVTAHVVAK